MSGYPQYPQDDSVSMKSANAPPPYASRPASTTPQQQYSSDQKPPRSRSPTTNLKSQWQQPTTTALPSSGPSSAATQSRILHIYREGLMGRHLRVMDTDKVTPLYTVDIHHYSAFTSHNAMEILSAPTNQPCGTVDFGTWTRRISLNINNRQQDMASCGVFTRSYTFPSSIGTLKWENEGVWGANLACVTERGEWVAKFDNAAWSFKKEGKIEIVNGAFPKPLMDEIVVSGLAMVEHERRRRSNNGAAGGGGGG